MTDENIQTTLPPSTQPTPPVVSAPGPSGKAIAALILGILSLICCGFFCGIPAIIIGRQELNAIKSGASDPAGQTVAQIGLILGIIGTVLSCLGFLVYAAVIIFGISLSFMEGIQQGSFAL